MTVVSVLQLDVVAAAVAAARVQQGGVDLRGQVGIAAAQASRFHCAVAAVASDIIHVCMHICTHTHVTYMCVCARARAYMFVYVYGRMICTQGEEIFSQSQRCTAPWTAHPRIIRHCWQSKI